MYKLKPLTIKLKRIYVDEKNDVNDMKVPFKKRIIEKSEKENEGDVARNSPSKNSSKSLENSPNSNKTTPKAKNIFLDEKNDVISEIFLELQKSGSKFATKTPPKRNSINYKNSSSSKKSISESRTGNEKKSKRGLLKEFDDLYSSPKEKSKSVVKKNVPELEKLPEDLILNFKRTPKKILDLGSFNIPEKNESDKTPSRKSSRRKSSIINDLGIADFEKTPVCRSSKDGDLLSIQNRTEVYRHLFLHAAASAPRAQRRTRKSQPPSITLNSGEDKSPVCTAPGRRSCSAKKLEMEPRTPTTKTIERLPTTPLEKARMSLHLSAVPECLPCREKEFTNILLFLENKLCDGTGGCMYISGVPGTGKTATVTQVIRHLKESSKEGNVPEFKYIELNGMRLSDPRQAYVQLWQKLVDKKEKITPDRAQRLLDNWFTKRGRTNDKKTTILLVDELDLICTKKQDVVYNLLDWPTRTHSRLVVLAIANTMDMPERLFKGRITSRMGLTRLTFMPYTHKQLEEIVMARLEGLNAFVTDAVRLVSRKVAAVSGDARRALDICRRATELPPPDETVKISHIEQAIKEMTNSNIVKVIRNCGEMEKLFLRSLSDVSSRTNVEEVDLPVVIDQLLAVCILEGIPRPSITTVLSVSNRLKCCRLIFSNQSSGGILQRLVLNVTQDDIHYALRT